MVLTHVNIFLVWIFWRYCVHFVSCYGFRAIRAKKILPRATTGHQKYGPGRVGPLKNSGPRAKFRVGLWPDPALAMSPYTDFDFELVLTQSADTLSLILQNICKLTYNFSTIHWTLILSKKVISYGSKYLWWPWTFGDDSCQRYLCLMGHYNDVYLI